MLLSRLISGGSNYRAATLENPSFDLNSPDAWDNLGASRSATGQPVSPENALTWACWYRGVTLIAQYCAKTPLHVFRNVRRAAGDGRVQATDHPAFRLLRWKANETQLAFHFQMAIVGHAVNRGGGFAAILREGPTPTELLLLDPDRTYPAPGSGGRWYVTQVNGENRKLPAADVFHVKGFGFDGIQGYPAWQLAKDAIGLGHAQTRFKGLRFKNQARPSVVLETPNAMSPEARAETRSDWERMHVGLDNSHRTAILSNGLKVSKLSFDAEEIAEIDNAALSIRDAASFLGLPSSKLGDVAGVKYASKEQDDLTLLNEGLDFWFCGIEEEARDKLLLESEKESGDFTIEFDRKCVARGDSAARATYLRTALGGQPWLTQNEARHDEGREPIDDPEADELKTPLNMGQGGGQNLPDNPADRGPGNPGKAGSSAGACTPGLDPGAVRAAAAVALADAVRRTVKRVGTQATRAAKEPAKFLAWVDAFAAENAEATAGTLDPSRHLIHAVTGDRPDPAPVLLAELRTAFSAAADTATAKDLPAAVEALAADLEARLPAWAVSTYLPGETP